MKTIFLLIVMLALVGSASAQRSVTRAYLDENGQVMTEVVTDTQLPPMARDGLTPMSGFPLNFASNTTYKPMRGLALADLDGDGADEIILCHNEQINVIDGQGNIVWSQPLVGGMAQYPAAVGDIDGDGDLEIVALTAYGNARGGINVFDHTGASILSEVTNNNPLICAPVLADLNDDGALEIIFCGRGKASASVSAGIHAWTLQGEEIEGFPYEMPSTPAFTPTVADINNDHNLEIFAATTSVLYCISNTGETLYTVDGQEAYKYSYQSPIVVDFEGDGNWSLVGACHGDNPNHYVRDALTGEYREGWPKSVSAWTYSAPTVVMNGERYTIFMGVSGEGNVFYQYDPDGNVASGFPLNLTSGIEGFISVADIDGDGASEIVTSFNLMDGGNGFIRAWEMDGSEVLDGFPLRPQGLTYMNGANFGDIDGDGNLEIVTLTYVQNFSPDDPVTVTAYALNQPNENLAFGTYKGSNDRTGWEQYGLPVVFSCNPVTNLEWQAYGDTPWIGLSWNLPEEGSTGELVELQVNRDGAVIATLPADAMRYDDYDLNFEETHIYFLTAVYSDECEASCDPVEATVYSGWGIGEQGPCRLYPNPVSSVLYIEGAVANGVEIYNIVGQLVLQQQGGVEKINVEILENGIYFVRLRFDSGEKYERIVIER